MLQEEGMFLYLPSNQQHICISWKNFALLVVRVHHTLLILGMWQSEQMANFMQHHIVHLQSFAIRLNRPIFSSIKGNVTEVVRLPTLRHGSEGSIYRLPSNLDISFAGILHRSELHIRIHFQ